jgi:hypothetical protein
VLNLITPFDLYDLFAVNMTVVFVGNGPSLIGEGLGEWIDSHDVVIRFNEAAMSGLASDVGTKTDILVTNPYVEARDRAPLDGLACRVVLVISPPTRRGNKEEFARWIGAKPVLFTYIPDPGPLTAPRAGGLTTGVAALSLLRKLLRPRAYSATGFTMFLEDTAVSYWRDETPPGVAKHDMLSNGRLLVELLNASGKAQVTVTSEIAWLSGKVDVPLSDRIMIRKLRDPKWERGVL